MDREPVIRMKGVKTVVVGIHEWSLADGHDRYAVVGYQEGKRVVLWGDSIRKVVWDALTREKRGDLYIMAVVDIGDCCIVAQSLTSGQTGYVEKISSLVQEKRRWQRK